MMDLLGILTTIQRPRLLIRAARIGVVDYHRTPHLRRLLGAGQVPRSGAALVRLMELETDLNDLRVMNAAEYSAARHVDVLIAMMGEAQLLRASTRRELSPA